MRFARMGYTNVMKKLATRFDDKDVSVLGFAIRLGVADELVRSGDVESACSMAEMLLSNLSLQSRNV